MTSYTTLLSSKLTSRLKISLRPAYMGKKHCKWIDQHMINNNNINNNSSNNNNNPPMALKYRVGIRRVINTPHG